MKKLALMILLFLTFGATGVCQNDSNLYAAGFASPLEKPANQSEWHINSTPAARLTTDAIPDAEVSDVNPTATTPVVPSEMPPTGQSGSSSNPAGGTGNDNQWHFFVSPYLYFPGIHGTVGAFGRDVAFKASAGDLLSNVRFGIMGAVEARRNRFLTNLDLMYMRLGEDKALPFPNLMANTAKFTANVFILAPKVGYRLINQEKFKADFLTGFRYWYFGENLSFSPSRLGLNFSKSQNWVDPLVGGRIQADLTPKVVTTIAGDVGGWGTGSQLEYQVVGLLGYKLKPKMTLQAGYRYLYFDYEKGGRANAIVKTAMSGVVFGATLNLK
ncbi:MAG TPA: hypothetical protein VNZ03_25815 [Terriglobales bacterium]|jgi:hypothetical protein|nr:hypothetical protein [Terriglobales bacterium]